MTHNNEKFFDVIVIGGGASGMMAAGRGGELGKTTLLLEKNKNLGEKLKITGGGRCNITNAEFDLRTLLSHYGESEQFLYSPFTKFGVKDTFKFFESRGLPLIIEANNRVFPKTEKAYDVYKVLENYLYQSKVITKNNSPVTKIIKVGGKITGVVVANTTYQAKNYILATGGTSHKETGSTGDGFHWLKSLGHKVKDPTPSIVPLEIKDTWVHELSGITLENTKITFFVNSEKNFSKLGNILCTHFGLSGPLILNSAKQVSDLIHSGEVTATIDLFPKIDIGDLNKQLLALFELNKNKQLKNILGDFLQKGIAKGVFLVIEKNLDLTTKVHSIRKEERDQLVRTLKSLPITVIGLMGYDKAVVADGGIPLEEIDMQTMKSKIISNLFITGDLLDINRPSGGYSLQLCWTTGHLAGENS